jgi:hypothetical protein
MGNRGGKFGPSLGSVVYLIKKTGTARLDLLHLICAIFFGDDNAAGAESPSGEAVMTDVTRAILQSMNQLTAWGIITTD